MPLLSFLFSSDMWHLLNVGVFSYFRSLSCSWPLLFLLNVEIPLCIKFVRIIIKPHFMSYSCVRGKKYLTAYFNITVLGDIFSECKNMSKILQCKRRHTSPCIPFRFSARNAINEEARFKSVPAACSGQVQPPCAWMSWMCPARAQQDPGAMRRSTWQTAPPHDSKHGLHTAVHAQAHVVLPPWPSRSANRPIDETISSFLFYRFNKLFVSMRLMINKVNFCPLVQSSWRLKSPLNCFYCPWRNIPIFFAILQSYVRLCAFNCSIYSFNFIVFL